jgi:hypothetical protein
MNTWDWVIGYLSDLWSNQSPLCCCQSPSCCCQSCSLSHLFILKVCLICFWDQKWLTAFYCFLYRHFDCLMGCIDRSDWSTLRSSSWGIAKFDSFVKALQHELEHLVDIWSPLRIYEKNCYSNLKHLAFLKSQFCLGWWAFID